MEEDTTTSSVLLMSKIGAMIGLGFGSLVLGTLPLIVGRYRAKKRLRKQSRPISSDRSSTSSSFPGVDSVSAADKQVRSRKKILSRKSPLPMNPPVSFRSTQQGLRSFSLLLFFFREISSTSLCSNIGRISGKLIDVTEIHSVDVLGCLFSTQRQRISLIFTAYFCAARIVSRLKIVDLIRKYQSFRVEYSMETKYQLL